MRRILPALLASAATVAALCLIVAPSAQAAGPSGPPGSWTQVFADEFNGTTLDTSQWTPNEGGQINNVTTHASNVAVSGGNLVLTLAAPGSGATINSDVPGGKQISVGEYVEARVSFPGSGGVPYNWPAFWISGPNWPNAGEHDIAEGLGSDGLTVNYHGPGSSSKNLGAPAGDWLNAYHTYGVYRAADHADVYWDGQLVKSYRTDDNGQPESMIFNVGGSGTYGAASQVKVDWVRVWKRQSTAPPTTAPPTTTPTSSPTATPPVTTTAPPPGPPACAVAYPWQDWVWWIYRWFGWCA